MKVYVFSKWLIFNWGQIYCFLLDQSLNYVLSPQSNELEIKRTSYYSRIVETKEFIEYNLNKTSMAIFEPYIERK